MKRNNIKTSKHYEKIPNFSPTYLKATKKKKLHRA